MRDDEREVQLFFAGSGQTRVGPNQGPVLLRSLRTKTTRGGLPSEPPAKPLGGTRPSHAKAVVADSCRHVSVRLRRVVAHHEVPSIEARLVVPRGGEVGRDRPPRLPRVAILRQ